MNKKLEALYEKRRAMKAIKRRLQERINLDNVRLNVVNEHLAVLTGEINEEVDQLIKTEKDIKEDLHMVAIEQTQQNTRSEASPHTHDDKRREKKADR